MPPIILASTSRYRRELLARLQLPFSTRSPDTVEDAIEGEAPVERGYLVGANDDRVRRHDAPRLGECQPRGHGGGQFPLDGVLDGVWRARRERQLQPGQQLAAIARSRGEDDRRHWTKSSLKLRNSRF